MTPSIITDDVCFTKKAWNDYLHWQGHDIAQVGRINDLIGDIRRSPFAGIGKPEPLKSNLTGWWSRRIDREHRLVYRVIEVTVPQKGKGQGKPTRLLHIASCRFHY
jgi:toxin YoeB